MISVVTTSQNIKENTSYLVDFFDQAYGERFVGAKNFIDGYLSKAESLVTVGAIPDIGAAALLRSTRITACATSPDRLRHGSRFMLLGSLFNNVQAEEPDAYITIGVNAPRIMTDSVSAAGMTRAKDKSKLEERLSAFGNVSRYEIQPVESGFLIALKSSVKGPNYWQQVWDWSEVK